MWFNLKHFKMKSAYFFFYQTEDLPGIIFHELKLTYNQCKIVTVTLFLLPCRHLWWGYSQRDSSHRRSGPPWTWWKSATAWPAPISGWPRSHTSCHQESGRSRKGQSYGWEIKILPPPYKCFAHSSNDVQQNMARIVNCFTPTCLAFGSHQMLDKGC